MSGRRARKNKRFGQMDETRRRGGEKIPETITTGSRPQATSSRGNWSLLASVVHRRGLWKNSPPPDWVTTPRQRSRTALTQQSRSGRSNDPLPGSRLAWAARYSGALWWVETSTLEPGERRSAAGEAAAGEAAERT